MIATDTIRYLASDNQCVKGRFPDAGTRHSERTLVLAENRIDCALCGSQVDPF